MLNFKYLKFYDLVKDVDIKEAIKFFNDPFIDEKNFEK